MLWGPLRSRCVWAPAVAEVLNAFHSSPWQVPNFKLLNGSAAGSGAAGLELYGVLLLPRDPPQL